jgi:RNAse (barnase) inhibitor barstar
MTDQSRMRTIYIDCNGAKSAAEFWQRYVDAVATEDPRFFGRNLDAFWDAVEGGGPGWPGEVKLVFTDSAGLAMFQVGSGLSLLDGLRRIANDATQTEIELV